MEKIVSNVFGLVYWIAIVVFYLKGKVKWPTFFSLITMSVYPLMLGLILIYALPKNIIHGDVVAALPLAIALLMIIMAIFSLITPKNQQSVTNTPPSKIRWFFLAFGIVINYTGLVVTLMYFYVPQVMGHSLPVPHYGITVCIIFSFVSSVFLYMASRMGSAKRPNLMRKIVFLITFTLYSQVTLIVSLILIYSFPIKPLTSYPMLASLNMICFLFYGILLLLMRREFVVNDVNKISE